LFHVFQTHDTSQSFDNTIRRSRQALAIQRFQLIANAVEQLVEAFDQLLLPLRELVFLPLQSFPFPYQTQAT